MPEDAALHEDLRAAYLRALMEQAGSVPLAALGRGPSAATPTSLDLAALYVPRLTRRPEAAEAGGQRAERAVRWLPLVELLNTEKHLVVLGDPGSGKSALIDFVALCMAGELLGHPRANLARLAAASRWTEGAWLPIKVTLREFSARTLWLQHQATGGETLWNFIISDLPQTLLNFAPALRQEWTERGGFLLLDGLDEVPAARQPAIRAAAQGFATLYPKVRVLVTCRTSAYQDPALKLDGFAEAGLMPFGPEQTQQFVEQWYALAGPALGLSSEAARARAATLLNAIASNASLAEMAQRPLTLTLLAAYHTWIGGPLPDQSEEYYTAMTALLFEHWAGPKPAETSDPNRLGLAAWLQTDRRDLRATLNRLACDALAERQTLNGRIEISQETLSAALLKLNRNPKVTPALLAETLRTRSGLLQISNAGAGAFPHRAVQDYLAACHLTDAEFPERLAGLLRAEPDNWREVTRLAGAKAARGISSAAWMLAEALCPEDAPEAAGETSGWGALLAAQALLETQRDRLHDLPAQHQATTARIRHRLAQILDQGRFAPADAVQAGDVLAVFGDPRFRADAWQLPADEMLGFVEIPAGPFLLGSDRQRDRQAADGELPQHPVDLPRYYLAKYPVTVAQFRAFVEASGYEPRDKACLQGRSNHPVVRVTLHDVVKYCDWLSETLKRWEGAPEAIAKLVRGLGWRVAAPSEAEWEKAARGEKGRLYPWGEKPDPNAANCAAAGVGRTTAVGCFPAGASPYGCLDLAGNVWEWTRTAHKAYPYDRRDGREDLRGISFLVMRGGGFDDDFPSLRCACRSWYYLAGHFKDGGFRVALSTATL